MISGSLGCKSSSHHICWHLHTFLHELEGLKCPPQSSAIGISCSVASFAAIRILVALRVSFHLLLPLSSTFILSFSPLLMFLGSNIPSLCSTAPRYSIPPDAGGEEVVKNPGGGCNCKYRSSSILVPAFAAARVLKLAGIAGIADSSTYGLTSRVFFC